MRYRSSAIHSKFRHEILVEGMMTASVGSSDLTYLSLPVVTCRYLSSPVRVIPSSFDLEALRGI